MVLLVLSHDLFRATEEAQKLRKLIFSRTMINLENSEVPDGANYCTDV
jgi:hypothetical protein